MYPLERSLAAGEGTAWGVKPRTAFTLVELLVVIALIGILIGLLPGTYQVTVSAYKTRPGRDEMEAPTPQFLTPPRYNKPGTSELTADVSPDRRRFDFALQW